MSPEQQTEPQPDQALADEGEEGVAEPQAPALEEAVRERRREALAEVRQFGDPVLKSRASEVTKFGPELAEEADRMVELMQGALGIGLAATQLGVMRRMLVFQAGPDSVPVALINPEIEWTSEDLVIAEEGCLSLPRVIVEVERPLHARVRGVDLAGEALTIEAAGLEARVLQHEIDHLDGVLILDHAPRKQRRAALKALRSGEAFEPGMLERDAPEEGTDEPEPASR
jgi:peptide deformylase